MCVCVCVCVREREGERERELFYDQNLVFFYQFMTSSLQVRKDAGKRGLESGLIVTRMKAVSNGVV